jgi:methionyl-tRNA formyltransferase
MRVVVLSAFAERIAPTLLKSDDDVVQLADAASDEDIVRQKPDFIVCFSTRRILRSSIRSLCPAVNLHASYLPHTRGPNPIIWRWIAGEPHGVSIHQIDGGVDTGPILAQELIANPTKESLHQSRLESAEHLSELFSKKWPEIRTRAIEPIAQSKFDGSTYTFQHQKPFEDLLRPYAHAALDELLALIRLRLGTKADR